MRLTQREKENREIYVCQVVADAINLNDGADYRAKKHNPDPPDVELVSDSGLPSRFAEVVITPQDHTLRNDNGNVRYFERTLHNALLKMGVLHCNVRVMWTESAARHGVATHHLLQLAEVLARHVPVEGPISIDGNGLYDDCPELSELAHYVSAYSLDTLELAVSSMQCLYLPGDAQWIEDALAKKIAKNYDGRMTSGMMLVIDGQSHLTLEQIDAFRAGNKPEDMPFIEVWAVSMGRAYRLKP